MKRKFFAKNILLFLLPMMIPLLVLGRVSTILVQSNVKDGIEKNNQMLLNQVKNSVELVFDELDVLSMNFYLNASFVSRLKALFTTDNLSYDNVTDQRWLSDIINSTTNAKPYIHSVYIYYENKEKKMFVSNYGIVPVNQYPDTDWFKQFELQNEAQTFLEARNVRSFDFEAIGVPVVTVYKRLYSPGVTKSDGMIVMNIRRAYLESLLSTSDSSYTQSIFLLDDINTVLAAGKTARLHKIDFYFQKLNLSEPGLANMDIYNKSFIVMHIPSDRYNLKYVSITSQDEIYHLPITLNKTTAILLVICFTLGLIIAFIITRNGVRQLTNIIEIFELAERSEPLPEITKKTGAFEYIQQKIIRTFLETSYLRVQLSAKKYKTKSLELTALQAQINPHFLFNTLKTIFWKTLALTSGQNEASLMIEQLSEILQYSISPSNQMVSIKHEIENTNNYIQIQKVRFQNRFEILWEYEDDVLDFLTIKLLFQPFIENSIYHGFRDENIKCYIKIKLRVRDGRLHISIIDNGNGISKEELRRIYDKLENDITDEEMYSHIGLYNTNKRLQLIFGEDTGIRIYSKVNLGTVIKFSIPHLDQREE